MSDQAHAFARGQRLRVKVPACVCPIRANVPEVGDGQVLLDAAPIGQRWFPVDQVEVHEVLEAVGELEQPVDPYLAEAKKRRAQRCGP